MRGKRREGSGGKGMREWHARDALIRLHYSDHSDRVQTDFSVFGLSLSTAGDVQ